MPNGTSVTTLSNFNNLTPAAISNHKKRFAEFPLDYKEKLASNFNNIHNGQNIEASSEADFLLTPLLHQLFDRFNR